MAFLTLTKAQFDAFLSYHIACTHSKTETPVASKLSTKAQASKLAIEQGDFGCRAESVAKLVSAILGEEIVLDRDGSPNEFQRDAIVMYHGKPWIIMKSDPDDTVCLESPRQDSDEDDDWQSNSDVSRATDAQIRAFLVARYGEPAASPRRAARKAEPKTSTPPRRRRS